MNIDSDTMKQLVAKAIMDSIDDDARAKLLEGAISSLMNTVEQTGGYGSDRRTRIQRLFDDAVSTAALGVVRKLLDDEYADRIRVVVRDALDKAFADTDRMNEVSRRVADAIGAGLSGDRR